MDFQKSTPSAFPKIEDPHADNDNAEDAIDPMEMGTVDNKEVGCNQSIAQYGLK